jgi:hypothetical protein
MLVRALLALVLVVSSSVAFAADAARLEIPDFRHLQSKATESVDISFGPFLLWLAKKVTAEDEEAREVLQGIEAVHVRSYQFDSDNVYSKADIDDVRKQLRGEQWKPLAEIRSRDQSNVDIFMAIENDEPVGFAIIAAEPREFTIVNIVGTIDFQHLRKVQGALGLPGGVIRTASRDD